MLYKFNTEKYYHHLYQPFRSQWSVKGTSPMSPINPLLLIVNDRHINMYYQLMATVLIVTSSSLGIKPDISANYLSGEFVTLTSLPIFSQLTCRDLLSPADCSPSRFSRKLNIIEGHRYVLESLISGSCESHTLTKSRD